MNRRELAQLLPVLARMLADRLEVGEGALTALLLGIGMEGDTEAGRELRRWRDLLALLHSDPTPGTATAVQEALRLRGVPPMLAQEAEALLLGGTVGEGARRGTLITNVRALHLGMPVEVHRGRGFTFGEFQVQGGPGEVIAESYWLRTVPSRFEAGPTRIVVEAEHEYGRDVGWLRLRTSDAELRLPVLLCPQSPLRPLGAQTAAIPLAQRANTRPRLESFRNQRALEAAAQAEPASTLRGSFIREDLRTQGMVGRIGHGAIRALELTSQEQVLVISDEGATLFDTDQVVLWQIECPATGGWLYEARGLLFLKDREGTHYTWSLADGTLVTVSHVDDPLPILRPVPTPASPEPPPNIEDTDSDLEDDGDLRDAYDLEQHLNSAYDANATATSPGDRFVAADQRDGIYIWHVPINRCVQVLEYWSSAEMLSLAFNSDASMLATVDDFGRIYLYDIATDDAIEQLLATKPDEYSREHLSGSATLCGQHDRANHISFSESGRAVISKSDDGQMLWDAVSGKQCAWFSAEAPEAEDSFIACSDDGSLLALGTSRQVTFWSTRKARVLHTLQTQEENEIFSAALVSANGSHVVVISDHNCYFWCADRPEQTPFKLDEQLDEPRAFTPDGSSLVSQELREGRILRIDLTGIEPNVIKDSYLYGDVNAAFNVDPAAEVPERWVFSLSLQYLAHTEGTELRILRRETNAYRPIEPAGPYLRPGRYTKKLIGHTGTITDIVFSPDEGQLATTSEDGTVRLWSTEQAICVRQLLGSGAPISRVAFAEDGASITGVGGHLVHVWSTEDGCELRRLALPEGHAWEPFLSRDGAIALSRSTEPATTHAWLLPERRHLMQARGYPLVMSASGQIMALGSEVGSKEPQAVTVWRIEAEA